MADSFWVFCMANNVLLVFWRGYDAIQLRHLEKWYLLIAYGVPAIPPLVYVILDHMGETPILGNATLWCWVAKDYDWMRIAFFYAPVWVLVSATMAIYIATGVKIVRRGALLRFFANESQQRSRDIDGDSALVDMDSTGSSTTEDDGFTSTGKNMVVTTQIEHDIRQYDRLGSRYASSYPQADQTYLISHPSAGISTSPQVVDMHMEPGCSAHLHPSSPAPIPGSPPPPPPAMSPLKKAAANEAALAYLKVSFLLFLALTFVWVPSSVNRLHQFLHANQANFPLSLLSAMVLPTQGVWNALIYMYTTRAEYARAIRRRRRRCCCCCPAAARPACRRWSGSVLRGED
ncbi:hypothetical protein ACEQ8H_006141 [Pleosporales sp. CAS-2024a]